MRYQLLTFQYKNFDHCHAQVLQRPNWLQKLFGKKTNVVSYAGWVDFWFNEVTNEAPPYAVKCMLTKEWHQRDTEFFKTEILPKWKPLVDRFIKSLGLLVLVLFCSCDKPRTVITTRNYKADVITVDSVQYIVIPGTGIIKHEPR